jgi:hypothetical protein
MQLLVKRGDTLVKRMLFTCPGRAPVSPAWRWLAIASGMAFALLAGHAAWVETPTIDEFAHVPAGCAYWKHGRLDLYAENPPLWKLAMAVPVLLANATVPEPAAQSSPWEYGYLFAEANAPRYFKLFWLARLTTIAATLACGVVLWKWANELFDARAASITAALFFLNPNVLAHGHLATIDMASTLTILLTLYAIRWACRRGGAWRMAVAGLAWGGALLVKFTAVLLLPVLIVLLLVHRWRQWRRLAIDVLALLFAAWLTLNVGMSFRGSFGRADSFHLVSDFCAGVQRRLPDWMPVPLPRDYVAGFDLQKQDTERGEFGSYLFAVWSAEGWWHYNLVALVLKNPLSVVALVIIGPWFWYASDQPKTALVEVALPLAVLMASMVLFNRLNIGVRYLLPIFPLALLLAAPLWTVRRRWQPWLAGCVLLLHAGTAAWMHPEHLRFFNLAVGGPDVGHSLLLDSNLDWGQDLYRVPGALEAIGYRGKIDLLYFGHVPPKFYGLDFDLAPPKPVEGVLAVSLQYLMGGSYAATGPDGRLYHIPAGHLGWLRRYPVRLKAGSIWIFDTRAGVTH